MAQGITLEQAQAVVSAALGKADESEKLYREVLEKDAQDAAAQSGLILSLFNAGKPAEAEAEMEKSLAANPQNLSLLVGAAYWYAARGDGAKAVELAEKAVTLEPRYVWAHIALARMCASTSSPSTFGSFRSSRITAGLPGARPANAPRCSR